MEAKKRRIVAGAALAGVGVLISRSLGPKLHEQCRAGCGCRAEHTTADPEPLGAAPSNEEVRHAA